MFTIPVDETLLQFIKIFYLSGVWQSDDESYRRRIGKKSFFTFFGILFPIFLAANGVLCDNRDESIFSTQLSILVTIVYVKLLYLLFKKREILAFLYDRVVAHSVDNREEYEQINRTLKKFMRFAGPYCLAIMMSAVSIILIKLPIFSTDKGLPFFISFSWNDSEIIYWLAYVIVTLSAFLCGVTNLITPFIWYIMLNFSIEYELLGNGLRNIGVERKSIKTIAKNEGILRLSERSVYVGDLIVLIKTHRNLTETIERFRSFFSTLFMGQIATSGTAICVSVYSLAFIDLFRVLVLQFYSFHIIPHVVNKRESLHPLVLVWNGINASKENILQNEMYATVLIYGIFDIFLGVYMANEITLASDRLSYCLFESNWIEQSESCKKYVIIMGEVLKQPQQLFVLIYPMNLETFMAIINGAYSMFNILQNFQ